MKTSKFLATLFHLVLLMLMAATRGICGMIGNRTAPLIGHKRITYDSRCWMGFRLFPKGCQTTTCREEAILTRNGPVVLVTASRLFTGATRSDKQHSGEVGDDCKLRGFIYIAFLVWNEKFLRLPVLDTICV